MKRPKPCWCLAAFLAASPLLLEGQWKPANPAAAAPPPVLNPVPPKSPGENPTFAIQVNLVRLLVTVRQPSGALVSSLGKDDFHIFDTGVPQQIVHFERTTSVPLSVAVLIDTSGSTTGDLGYEKESVLRFIPTLLGAGNERDSFALFSFNWRTSLEADYSRSLKRAEHALHALRGEGGTSLYDAVYLACDTLLGREGRHVIVLITDGGDTTSYKRYADALFAAQRADAVVYPIVVVPIWSDAGRNTGGEHALTTLAESTGGRIFFPEGMDRLDRAFGDIIEELRTQYLLGFYPTNVASAGRLFHPIKVDVRDTGLRVGARSGYYEP